jgi:hypothetical protein
MAVPPRKILYRFLLWTVVGWVSALPSFLVAMSEFDVAAMTLAIFLYILLLTALTCTAWFESFRAKRYVRASLYAGYGTRVGISLALPLAVAVDMWPGILSISIVGGMGMDESSFAGTFCATMIQGTLINIIVLILMGGVYGGCRIFGRAPAEGHCPHCGYDLRGSSGRPCPECGAPSVGTDPSARAA